MSLILQPAKQTQVDEIDQLVNAAYRGASGWTKESAIINGLRTHRDEISGYLNKPNAHLLVAIEADEIIACICIEKESKESTFLERGFGLALEGRNRSNLR